MTRESHSADIRGNLGRLLLAAGRRKEAHEAFVRGLKLKSNPALIVRQLRLTGLRRRSVLPFLDSQHPFNRRLGRLRSKPDESRRDSSNNASHPINGTAGA